MRIFFLTFLFTMACSSTPDEEKIEYTCKQGHKLTCPKNKCDEYCKKYEAYDDPNMIKRSGDSDNPFILDDTEEQVEFGHGN